MGVHINALAHDMAVPVPKYLHPSFSSFLACLLQMTSCHGMVHSIHFGITKYSAKKLFHFLVPTSSLYIASVNTITHVVLTFVKAFYMWFFTIKSGNESFPMESSKVPGHNVEGFLECSLEDEGRA